MALMDAKHSYMEYMGSEEFRGCHWQNGWRAGLKACIRVSSFLEKEQAARAPVNVWIQIWEMGIEEEYLHSFAYAPIFEGEKELVDRGLLHTCQTPYPQFRLALSYEFQEGDFVTSSTTFQINDDATTPEGRRLNLRLRFDDLGDRDDRDHFVRLEIDTKYLVPYQYTVLSWNQCLAAAVDRKDDMIDAAAFPLGSSRVSWYGGSDIHREFRKTANVPHGWPSTEKEFKDSEKTGHYLGRGGFGKVYKVYSQGHRLALKRMTVSNATQTELNIMHKLTGHKHVLRYVGSYLQDSEILNVLIWPVCVCDLDALLRRPSPYIMAALNITPGTLAQYLRSLYGCIMNGLEYLHDNEIIHHDFKPANILLRSRGPGCKGGAFISDFGLSRDFSKRNTFKGSGRRVIGTRRYFSPEIKNRAPRGRASDIYAAGITFVEVETLISGGVQRIDKLHDLLSDNVGRPRPLWQWVKQIIPDPNTPFLHLLRGMLHKNPKQRPTVSEVVSELDSLEEETDHWYHGPCCKEPRRPPPVYTYSLGVDFSDLSLCSTSDYPSQDQHCMDVGIPSADSTLYYT